MLSLAKQATEYYTRKVINDLFKSLNDFAKELAMAKGSGIFLTNNYIKDIIKAISSLENRGNLLKGTTKKATSQKGALLNSLGPLMKTGLPLMKNVPPPRTKSILVPSGLT